MIQEHIDWVATNIHLFQNRSYRLTKEEMAKLLEIYNSITGENKRATACGRCVANVLKRIKTEYDKL